MASGGYDQEQVRRWLRILHADSPGLIHICSTTDWSGRVFANLDAATTYVTHLNSERREGIYTRITTLRAGLPAGKRGGAADSLALPALWADLDLAGPGHAEQDLPPDEQAGRQIIADSGLPEPTIWVHSGGGLYPIWLLTEPEQLTAENLDAIKTLAADWQRIIEHAAAARGWRYGRGVGDLARVLRIPGTLNRKAGLERLCRILTATSTRYTIEQLRDALDAAIARIAPPPADHSGTAVDHSGTAARTKVVAAVDRPAGSITPGDDFAARATWAQILEPAGWTVHYRQDDVTYWTRPGKTTGISASTNALGTDRLHVFTTSANPLQGGESYSKLGAYAALAHGGDHSAAARALADAGYGTPLPNPADIHRQALAEILGTPAPAPEPQAPVRAAQAAAGRTGWVAEVDATNPAVAADWLRDTIGRARLAGYFHRDGAVVHTPREGEDGYQHTTQAETDDDGPAQVRAINDSTLASRVTWTYGVFKLVKRGDTYVEIPALFPKAAARAAVDAPDMMRYLRPLRGVVHSPVLRADGSVLAAPGYDPGTALLYLPDPGLQLPPVPDHPTGQAVADAAALLDRMIDGFAFLSKDHRANYLGLLLTPLLRELTPPPYQLAAITAPQPGSGKTLLATLARIIHGGVFRAELPADDDELRKQITTILDYTTGPVVHFDNVSGTVRSSVVAALLTSARWDDRRLGTNQLVQARNDRLWIVTGNNLALGGDLARRTIWITIDPGVPDPHLRTGFAITDLERWTLQHRPQLLAALLTLARAWVAAGQPVQAPRSSDSYSRWTQVIAGILATAGIEGQFAAPESARQNIGSDDEEWHEFLTHVHKHFGHESWTVKELTGNIDNGSLLSPGAIPLDCLPSDLAEKAARPSVGVGGIGKSLGRWLRNREGRWAGGLAVRSAGVDRTKVALWRIESKEPNQ